MMYGYEIGEVCGRNNCKGVIENIEPEGGCSCHIRPPCGYCTTPREFCPNCDWQAKHDTIINDFRVNVAPDTGLHRFWEPRKLDHTKIDWHSRGHTNSSMVKEGVYPEGATIEDVRKEVVGTFGGRFEHFGGGKFKYIAYTD